jgi:5-methylthioadenosine/S-adenosylhomocysteine deaminase
MAHESPRSRVDTLIKGGTLITIDPARPIIDPGYLAIDDGKIIGLGFDEGEQYSANNVIDASNKIVLPGLINAHNHLDQSIYRGCFDGKPNSRDLMLRVAKGLTRERARVAAQLTLLELVRQGVTTTHESHWTHYHADSTYGICDAIVQSGMRAVVARGMNDNDRTPVEFRERIESVCEDLDKLRQCYESSRIRIIPEATTILRCSRDAIVAMRSWACRHGTLWHMHLAQNQDELVEALGCLGCGSVQYAERLGVLGPEMLAAHCSGVLVEELRLLGDNEVRVAHCPLTIIRGGGLVPPIWQLETLGATVAIGTDGSATNNGQNLWEAMKLAVYLQRVRFQDKLLGTAEQALELATIKAARALGLEQEIGSLTIGKSADITILSRNQLHLMPDASLVNNLVFSSVTTVADTVLVEGKVLLQGGHSTVWDEREVMDQSRQIQRIMIDDADLTGFEKVP